MASCTFILLDYKLFLEEVTIITCSRLLDDEESCAKIARGQLRRSGVVGPVSIVFNYLTLLHQLLVDPMIDQLQQYPSTLMLKGLCHGSPVDFV